MRHPKYVLAVQQVLEQRSRLSQHREQEQSAFLRHENALALLVRLRLSLSVFFSVLLVSCFMLSGALDS